MLNPGVYSLTQNAGATALAIAGASTTICEVIDDLDGMTAASIQASFSYGSGGTKVSVFTQTSFDSGNSWVDVACMTFLAASGVKIINLSALTPKTAALVPTDGALPDDTAVDGVLGDRLRVKVMSTGVYANSVLSVRAAVR